MGRVLWLDGLRGVASAIVAVYHFKTYEPKAVFGFLASSYWDDPREENRRLLQLPPVRLLFSGASMVTLFMVISGYAISLPLLKSRDDTLGANSAFFRRLSSASTRRIFRIYLPSIAILFITQLLYFLNLCQWEPPNDDYIWGLRPLSKPWSHLLYVLWSTIHLLDISNHRPDMNFVKNRSDMATLNYQLWTMPVEFRGSCVLYLLILTFSFWRMQTRRFVLATVFMYWFYVGQWDLFAFVAGAFLAEGHVVLELVEADGELELPVEQHKSWNRIAKTFLQKSKSMECFRQLQIAACFISGIYLLCMCHVTVEETSPEYKFLLSIQSPGWDHPEMFSRCWRSVGAILTIYAISQSTVLQKPFDSRLVQFLGRISFPLYLVHPTVYLVIKQPVRNILWYIITQSSYPGTIEASQDGLAFGVAWAGALMTSLVLMVFISDLWERFIDMNCLALARKFEKWVTK